MENELICVQYDNAEKLRTIMDKVSNPFYVSASLDTTNFDVNIISDLLFNYKILSFIDKRSNYNVAIYSLPSIEERDDHIYLWYLSAASGEFFKRTLEYIQREYPEFGWDRLYVECIEDSSLNFAEDKFFKSLTTNQELKVKLQNGFIRTTYEFCISG